MNGGAYTNGHTNGGANGAYEYPGVWNMQARDITFFIFQHVDPMALVEEAMRCLRGNHEPELRSRTLPHVKGYIAERCASIPEASGRFFVGIPNGSILEDTVRRLQAFCADSATFTQLDVKRSKGRGRKLLFAVRHIRPLVYLLGGKHPLIVSRDGCITSGELVYANEGGQLAFASAMKRVAASIEDRAADMGMGAWRVFQSLYRLHNLMDTTDTDARRESSPHHSVTS